MKTCIICGKKFVPNHHREKCCSDECKHQNHLENMRLAHSQKANSRILSTTLVEKNAQARNMGLTYGQMVAMKYAQEHRLEV